MTLPGAFGFLRRSRLTNAGPTTGGGGGTDPPVDPIVIAPVNTGLPVISGSITLGSVLTLISPGTWNNSPTSYTYQWLRNGVAIAGQNGTTYTLVDGSGGSGGGGTAGGDFGATITCSVTATNSAGSATAVSAGLGPVTSVELIAGIAIGTAGTGTIYNGFKLAYGDDFNSGQWRSWTAANPTARYATDRWNRPNRSSDTTVMIDLHPDFRGTDSASPTAFGINNIDVADSVATLWAKPIDPALLPFVENTWAGGSSAPAIMGGNIQTWPSFLLSAEADWIFEGFFFFDTGAQKNGYWPAFWTSGMDWPNTQEMDLFEGSATGTPPTFQINENGNTTDGGGNSSSRLYNAQASSVRFIQLIAKKVGNNIKVWSDQPSAGTPTLVVNSTDAKYLRFKGPQALKIDMGVDPFPRGQTFNVSQWPGYIKCDWFRVWVPTSASDNPPLKIVQTIQTSPGGSWAATIPADASLWHNGRTPTNVYYGAWWDNFDNPGYDGKTAGPWSASWIPGGMTVNYATRQITGTVPTTDGGATAFAFIGSYSDGTPGARSIIVWQVAPAVRTLFANQTPARGAAVNLAIGYTDFHSGNLGPHTYQVDKVSGGSWLTITGNGTAAVSITGTAPSSASNTTLNITCTNSIGQTTIVSRTINVA